MPASEASSVTGVSFGAGKDTTNSNNSKTCTYTAGQTDIFTVIVAQAPDQATLDAGKAQFLAQLQQQANNHLTVTSVSGIGDAAEAAQGSYPLSGHTFNLSALYMLKGLVFVATTDVAIDHAAASDASLESEGPTALARVP